MSDRDDTPPAPAHKPREFLYVGRFISLEGNAYAILDPMPEPDGDKFSLVERSAFEAVRAHNRMLQKEMEHYQKIMQADLAEKTRLTAKCAELEQQVDERVLEALASWKGWRGE